MLSHRKSTSTDEWVSLPKASNPHFVIIPTASVHGKVFLKPEHFPVEANAFLVKLSPTVTPSPGVSFRQLLESNTLVVDASK